MIAIVQDCWKGARLKVSGRSIGHDMSGHWAIVIDDRRPKNQGQEHDPP